MNWPQLAYQYGIGGLFLLVTLGICFTQGAVDMSLPKERRMLWIAIAGFFVYLAGHSLWIWGASA